MNRTSISLTKRKKGLSVSLDKKRKNIENNQQILSAFNSTSIKKFSQSANTSDKKNKIKFVQSYQKYQTGSKFKKENRFKITDQDIKLGGNKKVDRSEIKFMPFTTAVTLSEYNSRIDFNPRLRTNVLFNVQRKILRDPNLVNLTQNINYFQGMNLHKQNPFCFLHLAKPNHQPISYSAQQKILTMNKLQTLEQQSLQQSKKRQQTTNQISQSILIKRVTEQQKKQQNQSQKQQVKRQSQQVKQKKYQVAKQSMDKITLQKLKKVQIDIDQLLAKASQTRAMLLR